MSDAWPDEIPICSELDIVKARRAARTAAAKVGFGITDVTRIVTAASELARNIYLYAGSGVMRVAVAQAANRRGLELTFEDTGPGIADVERALDEGYSSGGGLGLGLPGAKRLTDELEIRSQPGAGTRIVARKWLKR